MTLKIYVAGPLFTPYHRALHARNAARLRSAGFICLVPHERSVARAFEWDTGTPTTPIGIFWSMMQYDPSKKGVLGLLTDERARWRDAAGVPPVNAFSLGCLLDMGNVYSNLDDVIAHLMGWDAGRELPTGEIWI